MKLRLSAKALKTIPPGWSGDIYDTLQPRLIVRWRASGAHSYVLRLKRGEWFTLGRVTDMEVDEAREKAQKVLGEVAHGTDVMAERRRARSGTTFTEFLDKTYKPWAVANLKTGEQAVARLHAGFDDLFGNKALGEINGFAVERWRQGRLKGDDAVTESTVNRDIAQLKACLSKAVEWNLLSDHPLRRVKLSKADRSARVRYLSVDEEIRLRLALQARDNRRRAERDTANTWRRQREYPELPTFATYTDHLTPIVRLALNTGMRRGELFNLVWGDVDLTRKMLTVRGEGAKSGLTRHIPLDDEAQRVVKAWQPEQVDPNGLVFPGDDGEKMTDLKTAWLAIAKTATLNGFRFHDLRHSFASKLVQAGVDLASVRELLGHSDFALTLRYAHLAPENLSAAVAKLNGTR